MIFNWILKNKLAIGTPCLIDKDYLLLKRKGINSIFDLRNDYDFSKLNNHLDYTFGNKFEYLNFQLPDHNSKRVANSFEINQAINSLKELMLNGPVFMHCHAGIERSPLISVAFLHKFHGLTLLQAIDYVREQNKLINLSTKQLQEINTIA